MTGQSSDDDTVTAGALFDEETSKAVEAMYRTVDAERRRAIVLEAIALQSGERVIDVGTGPGFLAVEIADVVGPNGSVLAVDIAPPMVQIATRRCAERNWVSVKAGDASDLPTEDGSFDAAVSVQVHEYVPDVDTGLRELHRVLRPGGRALVYSTDWPSIVWHSDDDERMQRVMRAFATHCPHQTYARTLAPALRAAGFEILDRRAVVQFNPVCDETTFSFHLIGLIQQFVTNMGLIPADEAAAWSANLSQLAHEDRYFFAANQFFSVAQKPA
jgi:arsenite methyltransferase